jgi:hypothetical protein
VQPKQGWARPRAAKLTKCKEFRDFYEIRFRANKVQQRPIGYFGPTEDDFTILIWAQEKGSRLLPKSWCSIADRNRIEILRGMAYAKAIELNAGKTGAPAEEGVSRRVRTRTH